MRYRPLLITAAFVAAIDALTKAIAVGLSRWMPIQMPGDWALQVAHNNGVILGLGAGTAAPDVFAVLAAAEIAALLFVFRLERNPLAAVTIGLMLGAALGNLGEHQIFGYVVDWIATPKPSPNLVFNLADVAAACAEVLLMLRVLGLCARMARARLAVTR